MASKLSLASAIQSQRTLATQIQLVPLPGLPSIIAAVDCAFFTQNQLGLGALILWDTTKSQVIAQKTYIGPVEIPYIPGFLSFRELPLLLPLFEDLAPFPELVLCDGQGIAHPRRLGIASHLGVTLNLPTIGCGKSKLVGSYSEPANARFAASPLHFKHEIVGTVLRTKLNVKPIFVSPGHKMDLTSAVNIVTKLCFQTRLPTPLHLADKLSKQAKLTTSA